MNSPFQRACKEAGRSKHKLKQLAEASSALDDELAAILRWDLGLCFDTIF